MKTVSFGVFSRKVGIGMLVVLLACPAEASMMPVLIKGLDVAVDAAKYLGTKADDVWRYFRNADDLAEIAISKTPESSIVRVAKVVSDSEVDDLAKLPVRDAGERLGTMRLSLDELEDVYLRILVRQGKISREVAEGYAKNLGGVDGFSTTMRKVTSNNAAQAAGHLFELGIANEAKQLGFKVVAIGKKFADPAKKGLTDLDVFLEKNGRRFFIEAKNYGDVTWASLPNFRADMDSLKAAVDTFGDGMKVFVIRNVPSDPNVLRALEEAARSRGVTLLFGAPEDVIRKLA